MFRLGWEKFHSHAHPQTTFGFKLNISPAAQADVNPAAPIHLVLTTCMQIQSSVKAAQSKQRISASFIGKGYVAC